jgi:hypothetical protein
MNSHDAYEIVFPDWYDDRGEAEAEAKGWLQGVEVRFRDGTTQALFFYDPIRLSQDLEEEGKSSEPFVAYPGLIVIPRITRQAILAAVGKLIKESYFPLRASAAACSLNHVIHDTMNPVSMR